MRKTHKLSKEKCYKKYSKKISYVSKKHKKKDSNVSAINDYAKYNTEERENKTKRDNLFKNEHLRIKSKIDVHKIQTQNRNDINSFPSRCEATYNEEGMDELLFMQKIKRNRKK